MEQQKSNCRVVEGITKAVKALSDDNNVYFTEGQKYQNLLAITSMLPCISAPIKTTIKASLHLDTVHTIFTFDENTDQKIFVPSQI